MNTKKPKIETTREHKIIIDGKTLPVKNGYTQAMQIGHNELTNNRTDSFIVLTIVTKKP